MATPTPGSRPLLEILFENHDQLTYPNPTSRFCYAFNLPNLARTDMVQWYELPLHKVAAFYETTDCTYRAGKVTFHTGSRRTLVNGAHFFQPSQMLRSMMFGPNEAAFLNDTGANTTHEIEWINDEGSGLSSNWSDVLPKE